MESTLLRPPIPSTTLATAAILLLAQHSSPAPWTTSASTTGVPSVQQPSRPWRPWSHAVSSASLQEPSSIPQHQTALAGKPSTHACAGPASPTVVLCSTSSPRRASARASKIMTPPSASHAKSAEQTSTSESSALAHPTTTRQNVSSAGTRSLPVHFQHKKIEAAEVDVLQKRAGTLFASAFSTQKIGAAQIDTLQKLGTRMPASAHFQTRSWWEDAMEPSCKTHPHAFRAKQSA